VGWGNNQKFKIERIYIMKNYMKLEINIQIIKRKRAKVFKYPIPAVELVNAYKELVSKNVLPRKPDAFLLAMEDLAISNFLAQ
jgi:hypothetical protein